MKQCSKCDKIKPLTYFIRQSNLKSGYGSICKECKNAYNRDYKSRESVKKRMKSYNRKYRVDNPEFTNKRKEYCRKYHHRVSYGLSLEEAEEIYSRGCEICGTHEGKLCIDHCHKTGKIRGCLCNLCNSAIGKLKDSPELLEKAKEYLCKH